MWFSGSGGVLHLESPGSASVSDLRPVHGRVRSVAGKPNAIADDGAACCLRRRHLVDVFTDRGTTVDAAHPIARGERYECEDQEKARHDRICESVVGTYQLSRLVRRHTPWVTS
jgi:hypothetical protein